MGNKVKQTDRRANEESERESKTKLGAGCDRRLNCVGPEDLISAASLFNLKFPFLRLSVLLDLSNQSFPPTVPSSRSPVLCFSLLSRHVSPVALRVALHQRADNQ